MSASLLRKFSNQNLWIDKLELIKVDLSTIALETYCIELEKNVFYKLNVFSKILSI